MSDEFDSTKLDRTLIPFEQRWRANDISILLRSGFVEHRRAVGEIVYKAMRETINVPENDKFQIITEHAPEDLNYAPSYLGITYGPDIVFIQVTLNAGRTRPVTPSFPARRSGL